MVQRATKNALTFSALSAFALLQLRGQASFSFLVDSVSPFLGTEGDNATSRDELAAVITASLTTSGVFAASFLTSVFFFMCIDLSGVWRQYQLQKNRRATWRNYWQGLENFFFDFLFLFAPFNTLLFYLHRDVVVLAPPWTPPPHSPSLHPFAPQDYLEAAFPFALVFGRVFLGFVVGKVWSYFAHFLLHQKWLYRVVHKRHHVSTQDMVASHSWYETVPEFLFMELPNLLMVAALFPVHWSFLCLYYAYHAFSGASDHSGFKVNWLIDSEYHFLHHKQQLVNYGEFEVLDLLFRTHHSLLPKRPAPVIDQPHAESIQTPL